MVQDKGKLVTVGTNNQSLLLKYKKAMYYYDSIYVIIPFIIFMIVFKYKNKPKKN